MGRQEFWDTWSPRVLSVVRFVLAALFIEHGTQKLLGYPPGMGPVPLNGLLGYAAILEIVGGALLFLGLFTRPVAFILSGEMAVAYFMVHASKSPFPVINQGEPAILFCFLFLYYVFAGAGSWSLDELFFGQRTPKMVNARISPRTAVRGT